jgi:hypothetical protein
MVPTRPFPARLAPSSTPTNVRYAPHAIPRNALLVVVRCSRPDPIHRRNMEPDPNRFLSRSSFIAGHYTFLCTQRHFVLGGTRGDEYGSKMGSMR